MEMNNNRRRRPVGRERKKRARAHTPRERIRVRKRQYIGPKSKCHWFMAIKSYACFVHAYLYGSEWLSFFFIIIFSCLRWNSSISKFYLDVIFVLLASRHEHISFCLCADCSRQRRWRWRHSHMHFFCCCCLPCERAHSHLEFCHAIR